MRQIAVVGAGKIGSTIADMLASSGDYHVTVIDRSGEQLQALGTSPAIDGCVIDVHDADALASIFEGKSAVLSAAPYHLTVAIAEAAARAGTHYFDLTEDVASTRQVKAARQRSTRRLHAAMRSGTGLHFHRRA